MSKTKKITPPAKQITVLDYLQAKFGKDQIVVKEWKWTKKQQEQLNNKTKKTYAKP